MDSDRNAKTALSIIFDFLMDVLYNDASAIYFSPMQKSDHTSSSIVNDIHWKTIQIQRFIYLVDFLGLILM